MITVYLNQLEISGLCTDQCGFGFFHPFFQLADEFRITPFSLGDIVFVCDMYINRIHPHDLALGKMIEQCDQHIAEKLGI